MSFRAGLPVFAAALWWGSLGAIGFVAVPLLFAHLSTPAQAGQMAARLFSAQAWLSLACGMVLLLASRGREAQASLAWGRGALAYVLAGMLLALLLEFAVAPRILTRQNLALWHSLGTAMYAAQWVCAAVALAKLSRARPAS